MEFNACRWSVNELEEAKHGFELKKSGDLYVKAVSRQTGVGGYDSWGARTLDEYTNNAETTYRLGFTVIPEGR